MSLYDQPHDEVSSEEAFNHALNALLQTARNNNIDITGGWRCDGDGESHDYGIEIYPVVRNAD